MSFRISLNAWIFQANNVQIHLCHHQHVRFVSLTFFKRGLYYIAQVKPFVRRNLKDRLNIMCQKVR